MARPSGRAGQFHIVQAVKLLGNGVWVKLRIIVGCVGDGSVFRTLQAKITDTVRRFCLQIELFENDVAMRG